MARTRMGSDTTGTVASPALGLAREALAFSDRLRDALDGASSPPDLITRLLDQAFSVGIDVLWVGMGDAADQGWVGVRTRGVDLPDDWFPKAMGGACRLRALLDEAFREGTSRTLSADDLLQRSASRPCPIAAAGFTRVRLQPIRGQGAVLGLLVALTREPEAMEERAQILLAHAAREAARGLRRLRNLAWMSAAEVTLARLVAHTPAGVLGVSEDGTLTSANACAAERLGRDEASVLGTSLSDLVDPLDAVRLYGLLQAPIGQGAVADDVGFRAAGGERVTAQVRALGRPSAHGDADVLLLRFEPAADAAEPERRAARLNRHLLDVAPVGILVLDAEGRVTMANDALFRIASIPAERRDTLVGSPLGGPWMARNEGSQAVLEALLAGESFAQTFPSLVMPDGTQRSVAIRGVPLGEEGEEPGGALLLIEDVTEQLVAEERLRESERRFRSMFESAAVGMALSEADGRILEVNPTLARMLGYQRDELIGRYAREITHPGDRSIESGLFRDMIDSRQGFLHLEKRYVRKDGSVIWGRLSLSASLDERGEPAFLISMIEDVTERVALVEELTRARESLENLLDHLTVGVGIVQAGRFVYVNPALCRVLGHDAPDLRALDPIALIEQGEQSRLRELIDRLDRGLTGEIHAIERLRRRADEVLEARVTGVRIRHRDKPAELFVVEDVSREQDLHARVAQAQKLHTIGTLAGGIAHDVNNLLTGLASHAGLLRERLAGDEEGQGALDGIDRLVERAAALTCKLLAFGRRQVLHPVPVDVNELIAGFLPVARRLLGERIQIDEHLAPGLSAVRADALQIEQVLLNLAVNARDAMPGGGRLLITTEGRATGSAALPDEVVVRVRDSGSGIPVELLPRLFEPFFTTKPVGEGTGLGLAVAHGIVEQHGGSLEVQNLPEGGCEFRIVLPGSREPAQRLPRRERPKPAPRGGGEWVLVAEDDDDLRFLIEHVLRRAGYQVAVATDGRQAVEVFRRHASTIALVVLDMIMPDRSGLEALADIRALAPAVPALLISGYSEELAQESARGAALPTFLAKPFRPEDLLAAARRLIEAGSEAP